MIDIEDITPLPDAMDKGFRFTGDQWARELHKNLKLPGKFEELLLNDTVIDSEENIRMDLLIVVKLDNGMRILINIEHQSQVLNEEKLKIIDKYKNYSKCRHRLPLLTVIISPFPKNKHKNQYKSTDSDILEPVLITFDNAEIKKRLNNLNKNIDNKNIEKHVVLDIALISIFVLENRYKILKQLCIILKNINGIDNKLKIDMTLVLSQLIKLKLKENPEQVKELLIMIDEEIKIAKRGMKIWYEDELAQQHEEFQQKLKQKDQQHANELNMKDNEIILKDDEIRKYKKRVADLEALVKTNNILDLSS